MSQKKAPWTADEVASLNAYQDSRVMHPFTCGGCDNREGLVATKDGWTCPSCDYKQDWAHDFMAGWQWLPQCLMNVIHARPELGKKIWNLIQEK